MRKRSSLLQALTAYWITGIACSAYAILSYIVLAVFRFTPPDIFGAYANMNDVLRARGFFNEGGPFGVFLVSVFLIGLLRRHLTNRPLGLVNIAVLTIAFVLSASKAGFIVAMLLLLYSVVTANSLRVRVLYLVIGAGVIIGTASWLNFGNQLSGYLDSYLDIDEAMVGRENDYNLVAGRVSGMIIVPRMISAHPWTGIGFGNYPMMRNDPHYLGSLPAIPVEDLPGIGIPGIAAEMGVPATTWLLVLLLLPFWASRKNVPILGIAAIFQFLAHAFAVQLTFFYPWFVTACALAASTYESESFLDNSAELRKRTVRLAAPPAL